MLAGFAGLGLFVTPDLRGLSQALVFCIRTFTDQRGDQTSKGLASRVLKRLDFAHFKILRTQPKIIKATHDQYATIPETVMLFKIEYLGKTRESLPNGRLMIDHL
jgi:hypothetical protein